MTFGSYTKSLLDQTNEGLAKKLSITGLTQEGKRDIRLLIGLRQNRHTCLLNDLRLREVSRLFGEVRILDTASSSS